VVKGTDLECGKKLQEKGNIQNDSEAGKDRRQNKGGIEGLTEEQKHGAVGRI